MRKPVTPEEKRRIRKRHRGYAFLLVVVSLAVLVQPLALNWPLLTSLNSIIMAMVMMSAHAPIRDRNPTSPLLSSRSLPAYSTVNRNLFTVEQKGILQYM